MNTAICAKSALDMPPQPDAASNANPRRVRLRRFLIVASLFSTLIAISAVVWAKYLEDRLVAKRFGVVIPEVLYRSGQISEWMLEPTLNNNKITAVIELCGFDSKDALQQNEAEVLARRGIESYRFKLEGDGRGEIERYVDALKTIEDCRRRGRPVLVHCYAGSQRTGGVIAVHRLLIQQESPATVMNELRRYGWRPKSDAVLLDYLNENMSTLSRRLREEGVIDRAPEPLPVLREDL